MRRAATLVLTAVLLALAVSLAPSARGAETSFKCNFEGAPYLPGDQLTAHVRVFEDGSPVSLEGVSYRLILPVGWTRAGTVYTDDQGNATIKATLPEDSAEGYLYLEHSGHERRFDFASGHYVKADVTGDGLQYYNKPISLRINTVGPGGESMEVESLNVSAELGGGSITGSLDRVTASEFLWKADLSAVGALNFTATPVPPENYGKISGEFEVSVERPKVNLDFSCPEKAAVGKSVTVKAVTKNPQGEFISVSPTLQAEDRETGVENDVPLSETSTGRYTGRFTPSRNTTYLFTLKAVRGGFERSIENFSMRAKPGYEPPPVSRGNLILIGAIAAVSILVIASVKMEWVHMKHKKEILAVSIVIALSAVGYGLYTTTVQPTAGGGNTTFDVRFMDEPYGPTHTVKADVTAKDSTTGSPISGGLVDYTLRLKEWSTSGSVYTDGQGVAEIRTKLSNLAGEATLTVEMTRGGTSSIQKYSFDVHPGITTKYETKALRYNNEPVDVKMEVTNHLGESVSFDTMPIEAEFGGTSLSSQDYDLKTLSPTMYKWSFTTDRAGTIKLTAKPERSGYVSMPRTTEISVMNPMVKFVTNIPDEAGPGDTLDLRIRTMSPQLNQIPVDSISLEVTMPTGIKDDVDLTRITRGVYGTSYKLGGLGMYYFKLESSKVGYDKGYKRVPVNVVGAGGAAWDLIRSILMSPLFWGIVVATIIGGSVTRGWVKKIMKKIAG